MTLKTRKPTGRPSWPVILLAGVEKSGKSYAAAKASASAHIGRTFWIGVGEDDPDEYGAIAGARFEIVEHDGTYRGILEALDAACAEPATDGKPNMVVLDSATRLWDLLINEAQAEADRRPRKQITMDLWNKAKGKWNNVLSLLRGHNGPVIITSRFAEVAVVENGQPTPNKEWKVKAEKSLPYDVGAVVEMRGFGKAQLTSVRSLNVSAPTGTRIDYPDFSVEKLWGDLGVTTGQTGDRKHAEVKTDTSPARRAELLAELGRVADTIGADRAHLAKQWAEDHDGDNIRETELLDELADLVNRLEWAAAGNEAAA